MKRLLVALAACGDNTPAPGHDPDAARAIDAAPDVPVPLVTVSGTLHYGPTGDQGMVEVLETSIPGGIVPAVVDPLGGFSFDVPLGSRLVMRATAGGTDPAIPLIRGVVAEPGTRPRELYLDSAKDDAALAAMLTATIDPAKAIVEVDFRNAAVGGYGLIVTVNESVATPDFGIAFDGAQAVRSPTTVTGGDGSSLYLVNLPPGDATFMPASPDGTKACKLDDATPLPLVAGQMTWVDFECGDGAD